MKKTLLLTLVAIPPVALEAQDPFALSVSEYMEMDDADVLSVTDDRNELGIAVAEEEESGSGLTDAEEIDASDGEVATELIEPVEPVIDPTPVPRKIDELVERGWGLWLLESGLPHITPCPVLNRVGCTATMTTHLLTFSSEKVL